MLERIPALVEATVIKPKSSIAPSFPPYPMLPPPAVAPADTDRLLAPTPRSRANSRHVPVPGIDDAGAPAVDITAATALRRDSPLVDFGNAMQDPDRYPSPSPHADA